MTGEAFDSLADGMVQKCLDTLCRKADEYAAGGCAQTDRLHNFKVAAAVQGNTPVRALAGMMAKHTVSIYDMCRSGSYPLELWEEKICDSINYLLLPQQQEERGGAQQ